MAGAPDSARLHELLKSAARELKAAQQELADERDLHVQARKELDQERAKGRELQQQVLDAQHAMRKAQTEFATATIPREAMNAAAPRSAEDSTNVSRLDADVLEQRVKSLDQALLEAETETKQQRQRIGALEAELEALREVARPRPGQPSAEPTDDRVSGLEAELAVARAAAESAEGEATRARAETRDVSSKFAALEAELASVRETAGRVAELEGQLASTKTRVWELEQRVSDGGTQANEFATARDAAIARVTELTARVTQLESELAGLRSRRDELNVEVARAESERKKLATRVAELEAGAQSVRGEEVKSRAALEAQHQEALAALEARRVDADGQFQKEKEKHQHTAQRLLEARQRIREVETQLADVQTQLNIAAARQAEAQAVTQGRLDALAAEHAQAQQRDREAHEAATTALQTHLAQVEKELAHAITEWHHTNRQYEQLHREMLVLLDQRDEARRQLDTKR